MQTLEATIANGLTASARRRTAQYVEKLLAASRSPADSRAADACVTAGHAVGFSASEVMQHAVALREHKMLSAAADVLPELRAERQRARWPKEANEIEERIRGAEDSRQRARRLVCSSPFLFVVDGRLAMPVEHVPSIPEGVDLDTIAAAASRLAPGAIYSAPSIEAELGVPTAVLDQLRVQFTRTTVGRFYFGAAVVAGVMAGVMSRDVARAVAEAKSIEDDLCSIILPSAADHRGADRALEELVREYSTSFNPSRLAPIFGRDLRSKIGAEEFAAWATARLKHQDAARQRLAVLREAMGSTFPDEIVVPVPDWPA